jgi:DNA-binding CsgD family transcriptional regulator
MVMRKAASDSYARKLLTPREDEVLRRTSLGLTNAQVAADLGISVHAVKFHLASIFRKLGVRNRTQAAFAYHRRSATDAQG